jgi:uncharacterized membrane protein YhhN
MAPLPALFWLALISQSIFVLFVVVPALVSASGGWGAPPWAFQWLLRAAAAIPETASVLSKSAPQAALAAALLLSGGGAASYARLVATGLLLGAAGDAALESPGDAAFIAGLVCFLLGHFAYAGALCSSARGRGLRGLTLNAAGPPAAAAVAFCAVLLPRLPPALPPAAVAVYAASLAGVAALALAQTAGPPRARAAATAGALLFLASDGVLALDRFVAPFSAAKLVVMLTYYAAQNLIFLSACDIDGDGDGGGAARSRRRAPGGKKGQ